MEFLIQAQFKQYVKLQRGVTLKELNTSSPFFLIQIIHLITIIVYAKFYEFPYQTFKDINENPKRFGRTDGKTDGQHEP